MNLILVIISGLLTAFAFPSAFGSVHFPNLGFLAWFSLAPLFYVIKDKGPRESFFYSFITASIYYAISLYWLYPALHTFGHLNPFVSVTLLILVIIYISAYISLAPLLSSWIYQKLEIDRFWTIPIIWVICEFARNYMIFNGFPWGNITNTQYAYLPIIQIVDLTGIHGLAYIMIVMNLWVAERIACRSFKGAKQLHGLYALFLLIFVVSYGYARLSHIDSVQSKWPGIKVAMLQGNIPQEEKHEDGLEEKQLDVYRKYSKIVANNDIDLIVWPETAYPYLVNERAESLPSKDMGLNDAPRDADPFILTGALTVTDGRNRKLRNSMLLVDRGAQIIGEYSKVHLVPFGEYVPYRKFLFFAKRLVDVVGDFAPGKKVEPLFTDNFQIGGLVCYEDLFPEISREHVRKGANILAVITNDAWYGRTSAAFQHVAIAVFRAVENRRWMIRSANSGVSAVIDASGRVLSQTGIFEEGMIVSNVKLGNIETPYTKTGDWFAWACLTVFVAILSVISSKGLGWRKRL